MTAMEALLIVIPLFCAVIMDRTAWQSRYTNVSFSSICWVHVFSNVVTGNPGVAMPTSLITIWILPVLSTAVLTSPPGPQIS